MAEAHVVSALMAKRAELAGLLAQLEKVIGRHRADLVHLDGAIRLFAPAIVPEAIEAKRVYRRNQWFGRGQLTRGLLEALRRSEGPLAAVGLARAVIEAGGLDAGDRAMLERVQKLIHRAIRELERRGVVREVGREGRAVLWQLAR